MNCLSWREQRFSRPIRARPAFSFGQHGCYNSACYTRASVTSWLAMAFSYVSRFCHPMSTAARQYCSDGSEQMSISQHRVSVHLDNNNNDNKFCIGDQPPALAKFEMRRQIFVCTRRGKYYPLTVTACTNARDIQMLAWNLMIAEGKKIQRNQVKVLFEGRHLSSPHKTIDNYGVFHGSLLQIHIACSGGARGCFSFLARFRTAVRTPPQPTAPHCEDDDVAIHISVQQVRRASLEFISLICHRMAFCRGS